MRASELRAECERKAALGHTYIQVIVSPRGRKPWGNRRIWPNGPKGTVLGETAPGRLLVDCKIEDVMRGLSKLDGRREIPHWGPR